MDKELYLFFFFFKQKTAYEMPMCDWSSDVCSSDLPSDFDYRFNLGYGRAFTADHPVIVRLREVLDRETARLADARD